MAALRARLDELMPEPLGDVLERQDAPARPGRRAATRDAVIAPFGIDSEKISVESRSSMTAPYGADPIYSDRLGDTVLVIFAVLWDGRDSFQLYASDGRRWELVGVHSEYQSAVVDCEC